MELKIILAILFLFFVIGAQGSCYAPPSYGNPNTFPINLASQSSVLVNTTTNGKMYEVTVPNSGGNTTSSFYVVHVWGTGYEMGFAQGTLLKDKTTSLVQQVWAYFESQIDNVLGDLPKWLADLIADLGLDLALDATYEMTVEYTPQYFYDEMRGLADASGADYDTIVRIHMIAGLTQGACSMFGAWGDALADPLGLIQLRALDWNMDGPFRNYPSITVYHPDEGHTFAIVGMTGFIGGLTGISETQLGISEIGVGYPDSTFGEESRVGYPFIFLLRDILQWDVTVDDAINRMINAHRTCDLILGVGDGKIPEFRGMEYSYSVLNVFNDMNLKPDNKTWHPKIKDVVYWGMDWDCPSYNYVLSGQLKKYYGQITPEIAIEFLTAVEQSGDNHLIFYDLVNMQIYVSFAAQFNVGGPTGGYARQFTKFDVQALFNETQPVF